MNEPSGPSPPSAKPPAPAGNPWEQRSRLGFGAGLLEALKLFITSPGAAYELTLKRGDFWSPLLFGILIGWFGAIIGQIWQFIFQSSMLSMFPIDMRDQMALYFVTTPTMLVVSMVLTPIVLTIAMFLWSAIFHVSLLLVGALGESDAGFEGTFRVSAYANVTQLAAVVPLVGGLVGIIWWVALQAIGAARIHETTTGKGVLGVLLPVAVCCVCVGTVFFLFWAMIAAAVTQGMG